jgi:7-cyano-7-deazaguanine synthase in queuosine biosynthesis
MVEEIILPDGSVGVFLSGGSDSAILFWLLASQGRHDIVLLTACSEDKKYNIDPAMDVIKWVRDYTDVKVLEHKIVIAPTQESRREYRDKATGELSAKWNLSCWASGITRNPDEILKHHEQRKPDRDRVMARVIHDRFYRPFYAINKSHLALLYEKYEINKLHTLTVSCEVSYPPCGDCWWCVEREWAFGNYA